MSAQPECGMFEAISDSGKFISGIKRRPRLKSIDSSAGLQYMYSCMQICVLDGGDKIQCEEEL